MIDLSINQESLARAIERARERNVIIPTFEQMVRPGELPSQLKERLANVGLWDLEPANLLRITWKNEPRSVGGLFGEVNFIEIPSHLSGVKARILGLVGKWFPTGAHKVGASFGCLVPRLITGQFDPTVHKAVWPSTGNYCRGGAYNSALLGCDSIAILPEEMSQERFDWLKTVAGEVIATPGCESNVKEIYDKCWELRATRDDMVIFNQFDEFGNYLWHYHVTGQAIEEILVQNLRNELRLAGFVSSTGSAGTLASGDYLKSKWPTTKIAAVEALQCPTLLLNGYGGHRIEGIGDKHVPWIHNVRNTDLVIAVDDESCLNLIRLFNEPVGHEYLAGAGISDRDFENLSLLGISGVSNLLAAIKFAKYFELTEQDAVFTVFTDSMDLYQSRLTELRAEFGNYTTEDAIKDFHRYLCGVTTDHMLELSYYDRKRIHNLKYFTWIEQQGQKVEELDAQWHNYPEYWRAIQEQTPQIDELIQNFNAQVRPEN
ncbi:pyridoxal-phosphate dependent enzyme [bacterium]|nr:pyridoxal-phosphate dependent enzyme [bacterium]